MKTDFLIIGAAKSATTSLCNGLAAHSEICFSNPKEPQFFSEHNWRHNLASYNALFEFPDKLCGEGSTNYTKRPSFNTQIAADIYEYNPNMKLIYIMRHPIDRIVSHYVHAYNRGYETLDINQAVIKNDHYLNLSKYHFQLTPYLNLFSSSNIKLLFFDDFKNNSQVVLSEVFQFLNLENQIIDKKLLHENKGYNKRITHYKYDSPDTILKKIKKLFLILKLNYFQSKSILEKPQLSEANRTYLIRELKDDIIAIGKLTNRDLSDWLR